MYLRLQNIILFFMLKLFFHLFQQKEMCQYPKYISWSLTSRNERYNDSKSPFSVLFAIAFHISFLFSSIAKILNVDGRYYLFSSFYWMKKDQIEVVPIYEEHKSKFERWFGPNTNIYTFVVKRDRSRAYLYFLQSN